MINYPSKEASEKLKQQNQNENKNENKNLTKDFDKNIQLFTDLFKDDDVFVKRQIKNRHNDNLEFCLLYNESVVKSLLINEDIIKPLMLSTIEVKQDNRLLDTLLEQVVLIHQAEKSNDMEKIIESLTYGDTIVLTKGEDQVLILSSKNFNTRSIEEPSSEKILSGPREGFNESLMTNISLVRRKMRTNELKMRYYNLGTRTRTKICICYIDNLVKKSVLDELYSRIDKIDIDGVLDSNYIKEIAKVSKWSPFRTEGMTERPDIVAGKLLEGGIAILVDGSPVALTLPYLFFENFQSNEDYYTNFLYASFERLIRILAFIVSIVTPAVYIAIVAFHQEMLPTQLFISVSAERASVPLPAAIEAFVLMIVFDILKETGARVPANMGNALSIVGALVLGQAAVEAKLIAAPMVIIVAITAITNLLVQKVNSSVIFSRYMLLLLASSFGFFGMFVGLSIILIHLVTLDSFGIPYMNPIDKLSTSEQELKDTWIRAPWFKMKTRPAMAADSTRLKLN